MKTFNSLSELLLYLQIGRTTYFKLKKQGDIQVEEILKGNKRLYILGEFDRPREDSHKQYQEGWVTWQENGLLVRPWSSTYKDLQLHYIGRYFADFQTVSASNLAAWLENIPATSLSKRRHSHSAVSSYAKYLNHKGLLEREEYLKIKALYPKKSPYHQYNQRIIYQEELNRLIQQTHKGHSRYQRLLNRTLLVFLSETGLRVSEACHLKRDDLRFSSEPKQATVKVRQGKGGKARLVPFSKKAQESIAEYLQQAPSGDEVFWAFNPKTNYSLLHKNCVARRFQRLSQQTGIPFSAHSLRHYRITLWANNARIPISVVQKWAGHSSLEITQHYIHLRDEDALQAAYE